MVQKAKTHLAEGQHAAAIIELKNALQKAPDLAEARLLLGTALLESGDLRGAEIQLNRAGTLGIATDRLYPPLARTMVYLGESRKVIEKFDGLDLGDADSNAELLTALGLARLALRQPEQARVALAKAVSLRPKSPGALLGEARLLAFTRDAEGALKRVDAALEVAPASLEALNFKAELLAATGQIDAAIAQYRKIVEIRPKLASAHVGIADLLMQQRKLDEAAKEVEVLKRIAPKHPDTLYLRAHLDYRTKNLQGALEAIQLHLTSSPDSVRGLLLASAIQHELKAFGQAEGHLLRVLQISPQLTPARRLLVSNYLRSGQHGKAIESLERLLPTVGNDPGALAFAGETFLVSGKHNEAEAYFTKASALDPKDDRKLTGLALSHLAQGRTDEAFRELEQAASMGSSDRADVALVAAALQRREFDKALAAIDRLEKKQPGKPLPHNLRGMALAGKRDFAAARKSFEQALEIDPAYFPAASNLAQLDVQDKKPADARKRYESVLAKNPKSVESLLALAELRAREGATLEEVAAAISKAIAVNPTSVPARLGLINYYISKGQPAKAVQAGQDALTALPDRPEILDATGRAFQAAGSYNQAISTFSRWARLQPTAPMPLVRMADAQVASNAFDDAAKSLRAALTLKPDFVEAQRRSIALDLRHNRSPQALETARIVQKQRPKEAVGYLLEGDVHSHAKAWPQAVVAYRAGLKQADSTELAIRTHVALRAAKSKEADSFAAERLKKNEVAFRNYLAESTLATGEYPAAIEHYKVLLAAQPENPMWLNNLAFASGRAKDPRAIEYAEKALKLSPNNPAIMDTLGVLLVEKGDTARGIELLRKAVSMPPQIPGIRLNLAKSLIKDGQKPAAKQELEQLAKLGNKFAGRAEVDKLLKEL